VFPAFAYRRLVDPAAGWRLFLLAIGFVTGVWFGWYLHLELAFRLIIGAVAGVGLALLIFLLSITLERFVRRADATKLRTYARLFGRGAWSEPCGLAVLRGTLLGLALLGLDTLLLWVATNYLGGRLDSFSHGYMQRLVFIGSSFPAFHLLFDSLYQTISVVVMLPIFASLSVRLVRRSWLAVLLAAAVGGATMTHPVYNMGSVQPYHLKMLVLFLDFLVLAWTYTRYDLLTLFAAAFTFAFFWQNHLLLVMREPLGVISEWITFGVWALLVALGVGIAFQSSLRAASRRLAEAFG